MKSISGYFLTLCAVTDYLPSRPLGRDCVYHDNSITLQVSVSATAAALWYKVLKNMISKCLVLNTKL